MATSNAKFRIEQKVPKGWESLNTYFRNQDAIAYGINKRFQIAFEEPLRVLDIGSGVLEPFIAAALLHRSQKHGENLQYHIYCIDKDKHVELIMQYLLRRDRGIFSHPELSGVIWDDHSLNLTKLAKVFPAPEATNLAANAHLATNEILQKDFNSLIDAGAKPSDIALHAIDSSPTSEQIVTFHQDLLPHLTFLRNNFISDDLPIDQIGQPTDLILSNFAIQYSIQQGMSANVIARLSTLFNRSTVFQHGNIYWKELLFLSTLARMTAKLPFALSEFAIREVELITYGSLHRKTLRIRTDSIYVGNHHPQVADRQIKQLLQIGQSHGGNTIELASFEHLVSYMETQVNQQTLVAYAGFVGTGYLVITLPTDGLLDLRSNPLRIGSIRLLN